jgi:hypothetical protein
MRTVKTATDMARNEDHACSQLDAVVYPWKLNRSPYCSVLSPYRCRRDQVRMTTARSAMAEGLKVRLPKKRSRRTGRTGWG